MKSESDLTEKIFYKSHKAPSSPLDKRLRKSSQTGIFAPLRMCGKKHYPSDSPDPDTGLRCWHETHRPALAVGDELPILRRLQCASLAHLNEELDQLHLRTRVTETILWQLLADAGRFRKEGGGAYWLTIIRIAELALLTAGAYADSCESRAAGDLLANPVRVLIHLKGRSKSKVKPRHLSLSATLRKEACPDMPFMDWFRDHILLEVTQNALLPELLDTMAASGRVTACYLNGLKKRMNRIADTIAFLSGWQVSTSAELVAKMQSASPQTRQFIEANLCRFSDALFRRLGHGIDDPQTNRDYCDEVLNNPQRWGNPGLS